MSWETYKANIARLIKYLRTSRNLSQSQMGEIIGAHKNRISRIENLNSDLSYYEWVFLSHAFGLTTEDVSLGVVSRENSNDVKNFKIPKRLAQDAYTGGRVLQLHKQNYERLLGPKRFEKFCTEENVNALYLTNLRNSLNINFNLRLIQDLLIKGRMKKNYECRELAKMARSSSIHHYQQDEWLKQYSGIERLVSFINDKNEVYEKDHSYEVLELNQSIGKQFIVFSISPKEHVDMTLYTEEQMTGFIRKYFANYFFYLCGLPNSEVEVISSPMKGQASTILRIGEK